MRHKKASVGYKENKPSHKYPKGVGKRNLIQEQFPALSVSKNDISKSGSKLKSVFMDKAVPMQNVQQKQVDNKSNTPPSENKLTNFLENKNPLPKKQIQNSTFGDKKFNKNKINYDEEFPEL